MSYLYIVILYCKRGHFDVAMLCAIAMVLGNIDKYSVSKLHHQGLCQQSTLRLQTIKTSPV